MRKNFNLKLAFDKGYIADPYWPELEELINIQKGSGMNRARSEEKREAALQTYLKRIGMSPEDYADLEALAYRPWYRKHLSDDPADEILITSHQFYGCLIEAAKSCPASIRPCDPDNLRHCLTIGDMPTGKFAADGIFKRLVQPKSGTGQPLSNQRALRQNPFISDFEAQGSLRFFEDDMREGGRYVEDFLAYAGQRVGVGASRKMGWGRFEVRSFEEVKPT